MEKELFYLLIQEDHHGHDDIIDKTHSLIQAKEWFEDAKKEQKYCRIESVEMIGRDVDGEPIWDNNNTIDSYFPEDYEIQRGYIINH